MAIFENEQEFWEKVEVRGKDDCWRWTGSLDRCGYGSIFTPGNSTITAHRHLMANVIGRDVGKDYVCHKCSNKSCVNPSHLYIASNSQNQIDAYELGEKDKGNLKLSKKEVKQIKAMIKEGFTYKFIAEEFDISPSYVCTMNQGKKGKVYQT